jgi:hypothetical protein
MRYSFTVPAADLAIANTPELGGESKRTKISFEEVGLVAQIAMGAPASGTMTPAIPAFDFDDASGNDLVVRAKTAIVSDDDVVLTFGVTFQDNTTGSATASFSVPSYAQNQSSNLPMGLAVDLIGTAGNSGKKVKSADSLTSIAGGSRGNEFQLLALPATWYDVPGITSKVETLNVPKAKSIAHGLDGSRWTKFGLSEPGRLELEAFHISAGDGLQRLNHHDFSAMVEVYAEDRVLKERHVYGGCRGAFNADRKDGEDETKDRGTAEFNIFAKFV